MENFHTEINFYVLIVRQKTNVEKSSHGIKHKKHDTISQVTYTGHLVTRFLLSQGRLSSRCIHSQKFEMVEDAFSISIEKICDLLLDCRAILTLVRDKCSGFLRFL